MAIMTEAMAGPSTMTGKGVRTKLGCFTCRARKVKCDLGRPVCQTCTRLNLDCTYVKPEGQMNIPRLRRGRKRRKSDPTGEGEGGEDRSVTSEVSWAEQFGDELYQQQMLQQQFRRASTNTMPDLWRYQHQQHLENGHGNGVMMPDNSELASSAYLNSLIRRESLPVSFRPNATSTPTPGMQPPLRTASPSSSSLYSAYPSLSDLRRSMTPSTSHTWHSTPGLSHDQGSTYHSTPTAGSASALPPVMSSSTSTVHTSSPLAWQHNSQLPSQTPISSYDPLPQLPSMPLDGASASAYHMSPATLPPTASSSSTSGWSHQMPLPLPQMPLPLPVQSGSGSIPRNMSPYLAQAQHMAYPPTDSISQRGGDGGGRDDGLPALDHSSWLSANANGHGNGNNTRYIP